MDDQDVLEKMKKMVPPGFTLYHAWVTPDGADHPVMGNGYVAVADDPGITDPQTVEDVIEMLVGVAVGPNVKDMLYMFHILTGKRTVLNYHPADLCTHDNDESELPDNVIPIHRASKTVH